MLADVSLSESDLSQTLQELQQEIRKHPANFKYRVFLFQLLSLMGEWDRALTQLNVSGDMDSSALAMVQTYREALACEALRAEVFSGKRAPLIFGKPEKWVALAMEALRVSNGREPLSSWILHMWYCPSMT